MGNMAECKYYSFNALAKINDPELLYEAFLKQISPNQTSRLNIKIYESHEDDWSQLLPNGSIDKRVSSNVLLVLDNKISNNPKDLWFYSNENQGWFCSYRPLSNKAFVLFFTVEDNKDLIEEEYIQFLFHFYCHQLQMLQGTYRDALTGLYNRRAFNEKIQQLLNPSIHKTRRAKNFSASIYVMLDIDHFKRINDTKGHLFGDEVLLLIANLMNESFRENDLLFRYGGEEFAIVLMDVSDEQAGQTLNRFREKIASFNFPGLDQVTISIGYTAFDTSLQPDDLIRRADAALYYCKATTRNAVHRYESLIKNQLIVEPEIIEEGEIEIF